MVERTHLQAASWLFPLVSFTLLLASTNLPEHIRTSLSVLQTSDTDDVSRRIPKCPCDDPRLCLPITGVPPIREKGELFGFIQGNGTGLNWTYITTLAWADNDQVMCEAHRHGARAVIGAPPFNLTYMADPVYGLDRQEQYARDTLSLVQNTFRDGVVFDYEEAFSMLSAEAIAYTSLVRRTTELLHLQNPSYQITVCAAWSPDGIDGRDYPYRALADASDALYVMDYDTRSQVFDDCIASANAPVSGMKRGILRYLSWDIAPSKLILGVPWYGYRYKCLSGTQVRDRYCPIEPYEWRDSVCSDAVASEISFQDILETRLPHAVWQGRDEVMDAAFFNALEEQPNKSNRGSLGVVQYWYDDAISTRHKYAWARCMKLAGVGPYRFDFVQVHDDLEDPVRMNHQPLVEMWSAFDAFFDHNGNKFGRNKNQLVT